MYTGKPETIDEYNAGFPPEKRAILEKIRTTIRDAAPDAKEVISYRMPTFTQDGVLVHYAAFKNHIGLYPPVSSSASTPSPPDTPRPRPPWRWSRGWPPRRGRTPTRRGRA